MNPWIEGPMYKNDEKFVALIPFSGLCNRLRTIYSHYQLSLYENKPFLIIWKSFMEDACIGNLLDYYEKIPNVDYIIVDDRKKTIAVKELKLKYMDTLLVEYKNCISASGMYKSGAIKKYCGKWTHLYKELNLKDHMQNIINTNKDKLGKYIAIHIRRTDHKHKECDKKYIEFIDKYPDYNLYVATDNPETQKTFYDLYKDRIKIIYFNMKFRQCGSRYTNLEQTIIDLHMCIESNVFYGTIYSSFSELIYQKRYFENKMCDDEINTAKEKNAIFSSNYL